MCWTRKFPVGLVMWKTNVDGSWMKSSTDWMRASSQSWAVQRE